MSTGGITAIFKLPDGRSHHQEAALDWFWVLCCCRDPPVSEAGVAQLLHTSGSTGWEVSSPNREDFRPFLSLWCATAWLVWGHCIIFVTLPPFTFGRHLILREARPLLRGTFLCSHLIVCSQPGLPNYQFGLKVSQVRAAQVTCAAELPSQYLSAEWASSARGEPLCGNRPEGKGYRAWRGRSLNGRPA